MKFLRRDKGKINFLEADISGLPTGKEVDPKTLVHLGTDLIDYHELKSYVEEMEQMGVDYIFLSNRLQGVESGVAGRLLRTATAYRIK